MTDLAYIKSKNIYIRYYPKGEYLPQCSVWVLQDTLDGYSCKSIMNADNINLNKAIDTFLRFKNGDDDYYASLKTGTLSLKW